MSEIATKAPILDRGRLIARVAVERRKGNKIILTNGCFDILHAGHIRYLEGAKALGGYLVTAINSDEQVRRQKGDGRPMVSQGERAEIIASLRCVDVVTVFPEATVEELIRALKPDYHAKGTDYTAETVPEKDIVRECGGTVAIVGDPKDHSSTEMAAIIKNFQD